MTMATCDTVHEGAIDRVRALCRAIGLRAKASDWASAEHFADELAQAWAALRPSVLRGLAGRGAATMLDGTIVWITVAIGRRDPLATLRASAELALEVGGLRGRSAA
jgi:hypothetical protein